MGCTRRVLEQLRAKVAELPGVTTAAISIYSTPPRSGWWQHFEILGGAADEQRMAGVHEVGSEYFAALRIPLLQGRVWTATENRDGAHVALVNGSFAQRYFPRGDAIGHSVKVSFFEDRPPEVVSAPNIANAWSPIIGIVDDFVDDGLRDPITPAMFVPYTFSMWQGAEILVRTEVPPLTLAHAVRMRLAEVNPDQQVGGKIEDLEAWVSDGPEWQEGHVARGFSRYLLGWLWRWRRWVCTAWCLIRWRSGRMNLEFGWRLGAGQRFAADRVCIDANWSGERIVAGIVLAFALSRIVGRWAEGNSRDPVVLLTVVVLLSVVAAIACAIPARRAAVIDPMTALRCY